MEANIATVEFLGDVGLDLAAIVTVVPDIARTFAGAIETADVEIEIVGERCAIIEIDAIGFKVDTDRALDRTAFALSGLRDKVDHTARGV